MEKALLDYLLNAAEHALDPKDEAKFLSAELNLHETACEKMIRDWLENVDNVRLDIELNYHKDPSVSDAKALEFIRKYNLQKD